MTHMRDTGSGVNGTPHLKAKRGRLASGIFVFSRISAVMRGKTASWPSPPVILNGRAGQGIGKRSNGPRQGAVGKSAKMLWLRFISGAGQANASRFWC